MMADEMETCPKCRGTGYVYAYGVRRTARACRACKATGAVAKGVYCIYCGNAAPRGVSIDDDVAHVRCHEEACK